MEYTVIDQLLTFGCSLVCGLILGVLYEVIRLIRVCFVRHKSGVFFLDILFMLIAAFGTVLFSICYTKGITRYSTLIGELLAVLFARLTLRRISTGIIEPICCKCKEKTAKIAVNMGKVIKKLLQVTVNILYNKNRNKLSSDVADSISDR